MTRAALFAGIGAATMLAGCRVGPHYHVPTTPTSGARPFIEAANTPAVTRAAADPNWWRLYRDPVLDALVADAFAANTDLRVAYANIGSARGLLREARADRFPTTDATGGYSYGQFSTASVSGRSTGGGIGGGTGTGGTGTGGTGTGGTGTGGTGTGGTGTGGTGTSGTGAATSSGIGRQYSAFNLGFAVSYELDLFGRVYRQIQAARRDLEAERALAEQTRVTVAADTANAYVDYCANAVQEAVAVRTVGLLDNSLRITQVTLDAGTGTRLDVERARALREQTAATIPTFQAQKAAARYALAALTGRAPADLRPQALQCRRIPTLEVPVPVGDGASLIARRPDVRAAERTLAADTARIGLATASLYPTISLGGSVGLTSSSARQLFSGSAFTYSAGPLFSFSFPNQEAARGRILQARGSAAASLATFDGTVLTALRDTETALSALGRELDRRQALARARDAAQVSARLSRLRFEQGSDNFLTVLDADRTLAQAEAQLAQSDQFVAENQVTLFRALGGGWEETGDDRGDLKPVFDGAARPGISAPVGPDRATNHRG